MKILGRVAVFPVMPARINRIYELAFNLWWSWTPLAQELYKVLDPQLWDAVNHNPVRFLSHVAPEKLEQAASDRHYLENYDAVLAQFDQYMHPQNPTWFKQTHPELADKTIAYFSAEFGLHEALPIYSGGLGVLAGDHIKAASDLGLPFIGVGFLYPQGYFTQRIGRDGTQEAISEKLQFSEVPATPAVNADGEEVMIWVDLPGRRVYAKVWKIQIGRVPLYLMDTDTDPNQPSDRELFARLYGGNEETRIVQEIVLGIGGVRAVRALGYNPEVFHMNDSHPVFLSLERIRQLVQEQGLSFSQAREAVAAGNVFTTHTPVPAGNDAFTHELMDKYFGNYWPQLGLDRESFLRLALQETQWGPRFSMTVLALALSSFHNGVSKLHGSVSRNIWQFLWPGVDADEVPITYITNGVHTQTWLAAELDTLYTQYLGADWKLHLDEQKVWDKVGQIPDAELWAVHQKLRAKLVNFVHERVRQMRLEVGEGTAEVAAASSLLDPNALTFGFARRFATYKRATLIFRDAVRLQKILSDPERPVQIIFAGKAHPADEPGKSFIQRVYQASREAGFEGRIIFLENYDMNMARYLVQGVDVWLNNPIRPNEASGTSGQKASLNGIPNASILDGWWPEAYDGKNGWAIGEERTYQNQETQDQADSQAEYALLEDDIVPMFFKRGSDGLPHEWIGVMKEAIRTVASYFNTYRMVKDYAEKFYFPAITHAEQTAKDGFTEAKDLAAWKERIRASWSQVAVSAKAPRDEKMPVGQIIQVEAITRLGDLTPDDVTVELLSARDENGTLLNQNSIPMQLDRHDENGLYYYKAHETTKEGGNLVLSVRVLPNHKGLFNKHEMGLVSWA